MSQFQFFMTFYGLLLGLAVAELMAGFANLIGAKARPRLGLFTPLLGFTVFIQLMATFLDAWLKLQNVAMNLVGLAIPTMIGILFFVLARTAVPRETADWPSLDAYFLAHRRWTVGMLLAINALIWVYEFPLLRAMIAQEHWSNVRHYFAAKESCSRCTWWRCSPVRVR